MVPWTDCWLSDFGRFSKGRGIEKDSVSDDGVGCVRYGEIYTRYNECFRTPFSRIPIKVAVDSLRIKQGDILFTGSGETAAEIGKCVAYLGDDDIYAGGDVIVLTPTGADSQFLGYMLNHATVAKQKARLGQGDAVVHISVARIALLALRLPPLAEQRAIASIISDTDCEIAALEIRQEKTKAIKQGMMQALLTGRIRLVRPRSPEEAVV